MSRSWHESKCLDLNDPKDMKWLIGQGVDFITTNEPVKLQEILTIRTEPEDSEQMS